MRQTPNPWGLSEKQCNILRALCVSGVDKVVARDIGCTAQTVKQHMALARKRMGTANRVLAVLEWDRWARTNKETI